MVTRSKGSRVLLGVAMAGSLVLLGATCGGGDEGGGEKEADTTVVAERLCGGAAVSARAADALEMITGATRFEASGEESTVAAAARELVHAGVSTTIGDGDICRIYAPVGSQVEELRVTWNMSGSALKGPSAEKYTRLPMGERAGAAPDGAFVAFACGGGDMPGVSPRHLSVFVETAGMPVEPEGDPRKLTDAYATVAHSFSLAMAKELGCRDDGGLEVEPSLTSV